MPQAISNGALLVRNAKPIGFGPQASSDPIDILIGADGHIERTGSIAEAADAKIVSTGGGR